MSDIKELNNEELEKVTGGENVFDAKFEKGDWIKDGHVTVGPETVYFVKDVMEDAYNLIRYEHIITGNDIYHERSRCIKKERYNQPCKIYRYPMYHTTNKPDWVVD